MRDNPLYLSFLWHMHQPYYRDPLKGLYRLPWVRLHGTKDYLDMVSILDNFPSIKQNFNLVPSLLSQLLDYTLNNAMDEFLELTLKDPSDLTEDERIFILENFFLANWQTMISPFPRYRELLEKRGSSSKRENLSRIARYFSIQELRDLQALFNLVWIDPYLRQNDPELKELTSKGAGYTEEDKRLIVSKQFDILKRIIPKYKEVALRGQIELSFSPFYHPILPLLYDTDSAKIALPGIRLPRERFRAPEDVRAQLKMGLEFFESLFGFRPSGLWPSEGSVSEEVIRISSDLGIKWMATDEDILSASTGIAMRDSSGELREPSLLYRPYTFEGMTLLFRDHRLSDLIGFVYSGWRPKDAASDFISRLKAIKGRLDDRPYIISIILDGENAWEYYENDGRDFLEFLYEGLSRNEDIKTITISEYLENFGEEMRGSLKRVHPGSWIYGNFSIWIGHEEDNLAWDYLKATRDELLRFERENPGLDTSEAWRLIYIAEGSDWNWWYGDEHVSETQEEFDELFRNNLIAVYKFINREPPSYLLVPILRKDRAVEPSISIKGFISPTLDGKVSSYFEWLHAASLDVSRSGGSMHKAETIFERIYYGFDRENLYIRLDPKRPLATATSPTGTVISPPTITSPLSEVLSGNILAIKFIRPPDLKITINSPLSKFRSAVDEIIEIAIPFEGIGVKEGDEVGFIVILEKGEEIIERIPLRGYIKINVPGPYFEAIQWQI